MEVAGFVFAAVAFLDQAVSAGKLLRQISIQYPAAGRTLTAALVQLNAQKYSLELWHSCWVSKAERINYYQDTEDKLRELWGRSGHQTIVDCLGQLSIKLAEVHRTLKSVDPDSFQPILSDEDALSLRPTSSTTLAADQSSTLKPSASLRSGGGEKESRKRDKWFRRRSKAASLTPRTSSEQGGSNLALNSDGPERAAEAQSNAVHLKLSPGTKFKWSMVIKDEIRLGLSEIDEWLHRLHHLATQCEANQNSMKVLSSNTSPRIIRKTAKRLHKAVFNESFRLNQERSLVYLKLERQHNGAESRAESPSDIEYIDDRDESLRFSLLASNPASPSAPLALVAENIWKMSQWSRLGRLTSKTFPDFLHHIKEVSPAEQLTSTCLWTGNDEEEDESAFVLHVSRNMSSSTVDPADWKMHPLSDWFGTRSVTDPLLLGWTHMQIACTLAISVLHLYETGWIEEMFRSEEIRLLHESTQISAEDGKLSMFVGKTPELDVDQAYERLKPGYLECLLPAAAPGGADRLKSLRLAKLFHHLGVILFELGYGKHRDDIVKSITTIPSSESTTADITHGVTERKEEIMRLIDSIPYGRAYRDLVKICITGRLSSTATLTLDDQFNRVVIEKLSDLEKHFAAILGRP